MITFKPKNLGTFTRKVDLEILPGSFIDVSIEDLKKDKKDIINDNLGMFKSLGRVSNVYYSKRDKNGINIIIGVDTVTLYFSNEVNLLDQKQKIAADINLDGDINILDIIELANIILNDASSELGDINNDGMINILDIITIINIILTQ